MPRRRLPFPSPSPPALLHKILTESPTARITIPDIKKDRWYSKPLKKGKGPLGNAFVPPDLGGLLGVLSLCRRQAGSRVLRGRHRLPRRLLQARPLRYRLLAGEERVRVSPRCLLHPSPRALAGKRTLGHLKSPRGSLRRWGSVLPGKQELPCAFARRGALHAAGHRRALRAAGLCTLQSFTHCRALHSTRLCTS